MGKASLFVFSCCKHCSCKQIIHDLHLFFLFQRVASLPTQTISDHQVWIRGPSHVLSEKLVLPLAHHQWGCPVRARTIFPDILSTQQGSWHINKCCWKYAWLCNCGWASRICSMASHAPWVPVQLRAGVLRVPQEEPSRLTKWTNSVLLPLSPQGSSSQPFWHQRPVSRKIIFPWTVGDGLRMIQVYCGYCALYLYYYYISSPSDQQALDPRGWGPLP